MPSPGGKVLSVSEADEESGRKFNKEHNVAGLFCTPSLTRLFASQKSTFPFAVPGVRLGDGAPALHTDRGTRYAFP